MHYRRRLLSNILYFTPQRNVIAWGGSVLKVRFRPVLKKLKLYYPGFGWHAFRRQNITWRQQVGGATPLEAQRAAGHGSFDMTYLYTLNDAERECSQATAMFDKLLETTPKSRPQ